MASKTGEDVVEKLLEVSVSIPEQTILIKRLGITIKIRALSPSEVFELRRACTFKNNRNNTEWFNEEGFFLGLIVKGTVEPDWRDKRLLEKYDAVSGEDVVKKLLLYGEVVEIAGLIMELSGVNEEVTEIKN